MVSFNFGSKKNSVENKVEKKEIKLDVKNFFYDNNFFVNKYGENYIKELPNDYYKVEVVEVLYKDLNSNGIVDYITHESNYESNEESFYIVLKILEDDMNDKTLHNKFVVIEHYFVKCMEKYKQDYEGKKDFYYKKIGEKNNRSELRAKGIADYLYTDISETLTSYQLFRDFGERLISKSVIFELKIDYTYSRIKEEEKKFVFFPMYISKYTSKDLNEIEEIVKLDLLQDNEVHQVSEKVENEVNEVHQVSTKNENLADVVFGTENENDFDDVEFFEE